MTNGNFCNMNLNECKVWNSSNTYICVCSTNSTYYSQESLMNIIARIYIIESFSLIPTSLMDLFNMVYSKKLIWLELIGKYERWPEDRLLDVQSTKPELKFGWLIKNGSDLSYLMKLYWDNIKKELQWPTEYLTFAAKSGDSCSCGCFYSPKSWGTHFSKAHHVPLTMNNNELKREAELFKESKSYFLTSL